jgi:hypothetical protein
MRSIAVLFIFYPGLSFAQHNLVLTGTVSDKKTGEPLASASITLKNRTIATVANEAGDFTFHIPKFYETDTLYVSVMGYGSYETPLRGIDTNTALNIQLALQPYSLGEITINEELAPDDIFNLMLKNIKQNYITTLFKSQAFYRETQQVDGRYVSLIEAAIEIYNEGYAKHAKEKIKILQLRKSRAYVNAFNDEFWDTQNLMLGILEQDFVSFRTQALIREYTLVREENTSLNGKPVFVLSSKTPKYWPVRFYIQCDNYALVRVEKMHDVKHDPEKPWKVPGNDTIDVRTVKRSLIVDYTPYRDNCHLSFVRLSSSMIYEGTHSKKKLQEFTIEQDLMINEIQTEGVRPLKKEDAIRLGMSLEQQPFAYDPDFWKNYNMIQATPLQNKIRKDLEREGKLEEQFENSGSAQPVPDKH